MKTNLILASAVLACSSLSFAASGTSSSYGTSHSKTQGGTSSQPVKDRSGAIYDEAVNPDLITSDRKADERKQQKRISTDTTKDTDSSGHKTDEAPATRE